MAARLLGRRWARWARRRAWSTGERGEARKPMRVGFVEGGSVVAGVDGWVRVGFAG